jgi:plasmid stabilization system protein ParE
VARRGRTQRFVLTPAAQEDLREISEFIGQESPRAAQRMRTELREAMRRLAEMPGIGHLRDDLADEALRFWSVHSYVIVYRPETDPLQVLRVLHGSRDVGAVLERER